VWRQIEIAQCFRLAKDVIETVTFTVPRAKVRAAHAGHPYGYARRSPSAIVGVADLATGSPSTSKTTCTRPRAGSTSPR